MNNKIIQYVEYMKNKKVAILGIGISNVAVLELLVTSGAVISVFDKREESEISEIKSKFYNYNIQFFCGKDYLKNLNGYDIIFKTPIIRYDIEELVEERLRGAKITSEIEVFMNLCPAEIIAVTGSDGKTTTTTLIYEMLKEAGYKCWLGGNIGRPLISEINKIKDNDKVVLELSSFQLQTITCSPKVAVLLNVSPNHLDIHKSMNEYIDAKKNIFRNQKQSDMVVLNSNCQITFACKDECISDVYTFSNCKKVEKGAYVCDGNIYFIKDNECTKIISKEDIRLLGEHNVENYLAAITAVHMYVKQKHIQKVANNFYGVKHRMEFVKSISSVSFYNDSIGSSPTRTIAGLSVFSNKVILIAGGYNKHISYQSIGKEILRKVKILVLIGQTATIIEKAVHDAINLSYSSSSIEIIRCNTLEEAVLTAYGKAEINDKVIFSPASASFDMFKNFEERGNAFKYIVNNLIDKLQPEST